MIAKLWARLRRKPARYVYGKIHRIDDDHKRDNVRMDMQTGRVQFVLWKAGQQGHEQDYWHNMGYGWELHFIADTEQPNTEKDNGK